MFELVKVTNTGDTTIEFRGNERVAIKPGESAYRAWDWAKNWLGNPLISVADERDMAYKLIRLQWGYMDGQHTAEDWEALRPSIRVETVGDNPEHIPMLIEDPENIMPMPGEIGHGVLDIAAMDGANMAVLQAQIAKQAIAMDQMQALLIQLTKGNGATVDLNADGSDPTQPHTGSTANADANALATVGAGDTGGLSLPASVPTRKNAVDKPQTVPGR